MIKKRKAFIVGLKGYKITTKEINFLKKYKPWGIILFSIRFFFIFIRKIIFDT